MIAKLTKQLFAFLVFLVAFSRGMNKIGARSVYDLTRNWQSNHTSNWAVLVDTSRFWFNYRHVANTLSFYRTVKKLGIPDSHIILMLADDMACNPRNPYPGTVFNNHRKEIDLYGENIEVDYRGYQVSVENFIRLLTGRHHPETPRSKRLLTDDKSNILIYMTGHGGDEFLKFHDYEEITSHDLADAFEQMSQKKRYNEVLFISDTCQANTLYKQFYSEGILAIGSSELGQNSLSHHGDPDVGLAVIDRFSYFTMEYFEKKKISMDSKETVYDLFTSYDLKQVMSTPGIRTDLYRRPLEKVLLTDFFGHVPQAIVFEDEDE